MAAPAPTITFDFYGTLVQWRETLADTVQELLRRHNQDPASAPELIHVLEQHGRALRATAPFRPFWEIMELSLHFALRQQGMSITSSDTAYFLRRLSRIPAQPEAAAVLAALRPIARLAIISNTDDDMITGSLSALGTPCDAVVTSRQARAYKPDAALFRYAQRRLNLQPGQHLHVAESLYADMSVCETLEIPVIWINRQQQVLPDGVHPLAVLPDLRGLPELAQDWLQSRQ